MFDRDRAGAAVARLSAPARGKLATLCLVRIAGLVDGEWISGEFPEVATLVGDIRSYSMARAAEQVTETDPADLDRRLRAFLGPDGEPFEELPGWGAWAMDIAALGDYALRTWTSPADSLDHTFEVLLSGYSIAGYLEDDSSSPDVPNLAEQEFERQMSDAGLLDQGVEWNALVGPSVEQARTYEQWLGFVES